MEHAKSNTVSLDAELNQQVEKRQQLLQTNILGLVNKIRKLASTASRVKVSGGVMSRLYVTVDPKAEGDTPQNFEVDLNGPLAIAELTSLHITLMTCVSISDLDMSMAS